MDMFSFTGIILKEYDAYSSLCSELDVASMGDTPEEAKAMLLETATLHLEGAIEDGLPYMRPIPAADDPRQTATDTVVDVFRFKIDVAVHAYT
jgi:predicted RNase H-like HicB family nuclease